MTPEAQRIAIAEACGIKLGEYRCQNCGTIPISEVTSGGLHKKCGNAATDQVPDYLYDLNAMHEAEKVLGDKEDRYMTILYGLVTPEMSQLEKVMPQVYGGVPPRATFLWSCATAAQRAEAFLRTLNLWDETK